MTPVHDQRFTGIRQEALEYARRESRRTDQRAYLIPLGMLAAGWLAMIALPVITQGAEIGEAIAATAVWLIILAISVVAGVLGLVITCRLFGDDAGSLWLALVRLAGIYAVVMVLGALCGMWCLALIVTLPVMAGLVAILFEMDMSEGIVVALVTWAVWVAVTLGAAFLFG